MAGGRGAGFVDTARDGPAQGVGEGRWTRQQVPWVAVTREWEQIERELAMGFLELAGEPVCAATRAVVACLWFSNLRDQGSESRLQDAPLLAASTCKKWL